MKLWTILLVICVLLPVHMFAGEVFGSITSGGKPIGDSIKVVITTAGKTTYGGTTDKFGAYRLFVQEKGKCTLTIHYNDQTPSVDLFSYDKSTRYDWIVEVKDGKYLLKRK